MKNDPSVEQLFLQKYGGWTFFEEPKVLLVYPVSWEGKKIVDYSKEIPAQALELKLCIYMEVGDKNQDSTFRIGVSNEGVLQYKHWIYCHSCKSDSWASTSDNFDFPVDFKRSFSLELDSKRSGKSSITVYLCGYR